MGPEPIWGSTSNVPFLGRCRAPGELSQFLKWVAFITVMNALQRNDMGADAVLAIDRTNCAATVSTVVSHVRRRSAVECKAMLIRAVEICPSLASESARVP